MEKRQTLRASVWAKRVLGRLGCVGFALLGLLTHQVEVHLTARNDGGDGVLIDHLCHRIAQQHDVLVKGLDLPLQLDAIDQVNGHGHMLTAQCVEEGVLQKLAFIAHDILRVGKSCGWNERAGGGLGSDVLTHQTTSGSAGGEVTTA